MAFCFYSLLQSFVTCCLWPVYHWMPTKMMESEKWHHRGDKNLACRFFFLLVDGSFRFFFQILRFLLCYSFFFSIFLDIFEDGNEHQPFASNGNTKTSGESQLEVLRLNGDRGEGCQGQSLTGIIVCHPFWGIKQAANPWEIWGISRITVHCFAWCHII